jgi:hypothetical protein
MPEAHGLAIPARYWAVIAAFAAVLAVIVFLVLRRGSNLVPTATATPPFALHVVPALPLATGSPGASSPACPFLSSGEAGPGSTSVGRSLVTVDLDVNQGTTITSVTLSVVSRTAVSDSVYRECASALPGSAAASGAQAVRLPVPGTTVSLPALRPGGIFDLAVEPPARPASGAMAYVWQIDVASVSSEGHISLPSDELTLLAPPR